MPPRAVNRRTSSRLAPAQPDESISSSPSSSPLPSLSRPSLPRLAGTPASRRQYTYGSAAEPPPSRPGRGIRMDQPLDLGRAVDNVVSRQEHEDQQLSRQQMPPPPKPVADEDVEDELASEGPPEPEPQSRRPGRPKKSAVQAASEEPATGTGRYGTRRSAQSPQKNQQPTRQIAEDMRDDRSFGTESDYYGNASIRSSPAPASATKAPKRSSKLRQEPLAAVNEDPPVVKPLPRVSLPEVAADASEPVPEPEPLMTVSHATQPQDTISAKPMRRTTRELSDPSSKPVGWSEPHGVVDIERVRARANFRSAPGGSGTSLQPQRRREETYASNHSEADDAMQRDIAAGSDVDVNETPGGSRWIKVKKFFPQPWSVGSEAAPNAGAEQAVRRRGAPAAVDQQAGPEDEDDIDYVGDATNWWYLLDPRTYLDVLFRFMDAINEQVLLLWRVVYNMSPARSAWKKIFSFLGAAILAMLLAANASTLADVAHSTAASIPDIPRPDVSGLSSMAGKIGDLAGSIRIPVPSFRRHEPGIWEGLSEDERNDLGAYLQRFDAEYKNLRDTSRLNSDAVKKLTEILPLIIRVEAPDGQPKIGPEFYHAMRDKLRDDEAVLTFDETSGSYVVDSKRQWQSLVRGISDDPYFDRKLNLSVSSVESRLDGKVTSFWDSWIKDNDDKIKAQLGTALESLKAANSEAELESIVKKLVRDQIRDSSADGGTLITRNDFVKQLQREFKVHRHEIRTELDELEPQLRALIQETVRLANPQHAPPAGMTREDATSLVNTLIRKAIADVDLKAMTNGKIHAHWDADLKNQVNHFAIGGGAIIDVKLSSKTYDPLRKGIASLDQFARGMRDARPLPPAAALQSWDDEGDCWCAAREVNHRGNPHGATLSVLMAHQVVPQHIVIEHILPGATSDPGARPREIEVHIRIEDPDVLSRVRDFSATHFVERDGWNHAPAELGSGFVKIGHFTYEGAELHDGVHVQSLSRELVAMGAETDQVVVRAVSNYGAKEHTCLYRVRMYGERLAVDV